VLAAHDRPNSLSDLFLFSAATDMENDKLNDDLFGLILKFLSEAGCSRTLAMLSCCNKFLNKAIACMHAQPAVMDVQFAPDQDRRFLIPFTEAKVVRFKVQWGDGKEDEVTSGTFVTHEYASHGHYVVRLWQMDSTGLDHLGFGQSQPSPSWWRPLTKLRSLGTLGIRSLSGLFRGAGQFHLSIHLNTTAVTDLSYMFSEATFSEATFSEATSLNQRIGNWNVSNVTNMDGLFLRAHNFNEPLHKWNCSNVTTMKFMFYSAILFDQNIGNWDVSKVKEMEHMFDCADAFNQDLSKWQVGNVTNMKHMFFGATRFNQNLAAWDVRNVTEMAYMFWKSPIRADSIAGWEYHPEVDKDQMFGL
jgi:surface protein